MEQREVLIVAHHRQLGEVAHQALISCGYTCALATNGEEGLVVFRKTRPLLVITDLIIPVLQENPDVAVIALTNPLDGGELLTAVERVLGRRAPSRLRDQPVEGWRTPEQFLENFEYHNSCNPRDPQIVVGIRIIHAWMNLRSRQAVSQTDLDGLLDQFAAAPEGSQIFDLWLHVVRWGRKLGLSVPGRLPWAQP